MIMNKEIMKAMNGKKACKVHEWWDKNGYKVLRVVLFPAYITALLMSKFTAWMNKKVVWSEERAIEILNYYIPRRAEWDKENKTFYFFDNGYGWCIGSARRYLKLKDRRFWKKYCGLYGGKIRDFLIDKFEMEGFTKKEGNTWEGWTELTFYLNEKNA